MSAKILEAGKKLSSGHTVPIVAVPSQKPSRLSLSDSCLPRAPDATKEQDTEVTSQLNENIKVETRGEIAARIMNAYFSPKSFEQNGSLYKRLGVEYFKRALMKTVGTYFLSAKEMTTQANNYCLGGHSIKELQAAEKSSRFNEAVHLGAVTLTTLPTAFSSLINLEAPTTLRASVLTIAFVINAYCIMLQRFNRERLCKAINLKEQKQSR